MTDTPRPNEPPAAPGQLWLTVHSRLKGRARYVRVLAVDATHATTLTWFGDPLRPRTRRGRVRLDQFTIGRNGQGYRYLRTDQPPYDDDPEPPAPKSPPRSGVTQLLDEGWLLAGDAAARIGVDKATLWRWGRQGLIRYVEVKQTGWRLYRPEDLDRAADRHMGVTVVEPTRSPDTPTP